MSCPACGHGILRWCESWGRKVWAECRACGLVFSEDEGSEA